MDGSPHAFDVLHWEECDAAGGSCQPIAGSQSTALALGDALYGKRVRPIIRATNPVGPATVTGELSDQVGDAPRVSRHATIYGVQKVLRQVTVGSWVVSSIPGATGGSISWRACNGSGCIGVGNGATITIPPQAYGRLLIADVWINNIFGATWAGTAGDPVGL